MIAINQFEKAQKIYTKLKELNAEIIELDKMALLIVNNEVEVSFNLNVNNLTKKEEESEKISFDEDGSIVKKMQDEHNKLFSSYLGLSWLGVTDATKSADKAKNETTIKSNISVNSALSILGLLLRDKQDKRERLLQSLSKIGVTI